MISVLITVYNSQKTIKSTIQSIINQTFRKFEIIIINDGSTDTTVRILESYDDPRIKIFSVDKIGRAKALLYGVKCCSYDLVAICDADDLWHPQKLDFQFKYLSENPKTIVLCTKATIFRNDRVIEFNKIACIDKIPSSRISLFNQLLVNKISHSSVIIRKNYALYSDSRISQIDYELWLRLLYRYKIIIDCLNLTLTYHRIHDSQSFESKGIGYKISSIKLVNYYAFLNKNLIALLLNNLKLFYYIFSRVFIKCKSKYLSIFL